MTRPPWPPLDALLDAIAALFVAMVSGALGGTPTDTATPAVAVWERDPMPKLSPVELAELVTLYGFPDRPTAVAVILGESGGDPAKVNREPGNVDRGLWQISSKWHPEVTDEQAFDVQASTTAALRISAGGTDFNPWHATKAPAFAGHLRTAEQAVAEYDAKGSGSAGGVGSGGGGGSSGGEGSAPPWWQRIPIVPGLVDTGDVIDAGGAVVDGVTGVASGVGDVLGLAGKALGVLTSADFWKRAAWALGGLALVGLGIAALSGRTGANLAVMGASKGTMSLPDDDDDE